MNPSQIAAAAALAGLAALGALCALGWSRAARRAQASALLLARAETLAAERERQLAALEAELGEQRAAQTALHAQLRESEQAHAALAQALADERKAAGEQEPRLREAFAALSAQALARNNQFFLELAQHSFGEIARDAEARLATRQQAFAELLAPIRDSLGRVDAQLVQVEKERQGHYQELAKHLELVALAQRELGSQTTRLVQALRRPNVRGRWGELQLRRVIELAGMLERCDFLEQSSADTEQGRLRPDVLVQLPGAKLVVIDAKTPLDAYLSAIEAEDEPSRVEHLREHARQVRRHMEQLGRRSYWEQFPASPEFVVMFLPGEAFFSAALEQDAELLERGVRERVLAASPTTLIALLRAVAYGWRQERIAANAEEISQLGRVLHARLATLGEHLARLGRQLGGAVGSYNQVVGSFETRVCSAARRFQELGAAAGTELRGGEPIAQGVRGLAGAAEAPEVSAPCQAPAGPSGA